MGLWVKSTSEGFQYTAANIVEDFNNDYCTKLASAPVSIIMFSCYDMDSFSVIIFLNSSFILENIFTYIP